MKKIVLTFGVISGVIASAVMLLNILVVNDHGNTGLILGYTGIVLSLLLVFFGVRSYRENVGGGAMSFGRGLAVGLLISVISCVFYVATWELLYFKVMPEFGDRLVAQMVAEARSSGAAPDVIAKKEQEAHQMKTMLDQPLANMAMAFIEPFPVGVLVAFVSAAVLRRKPR